MGLVDHLFVCRHVGVLLEHPLAKASHHDSDLDVPAKLGPQIIYSFLALGRCHHGERKVWMGRYLVGSGLCDVDL